MSHVSCNTPLGDGNLQAQLEHANTMTDTEVPLLIWTIVEINLSIVSACLPTLRPLFLRVRYGKAIKSISYPTRTTPKMSKQSNDGTTSLDTESPDEAGIDVLPMEQEQLNSALTERQRESKVGLAL